MNILIESLTGIEIINAERQEQIAKGFTPEEDAKTHPHGEMAQAAIAYLSPGTNDRRAIPRMWPWSREWWKPSKHTIERRRITNADRIKELAKAGALIAAEIDRLKRPGAAINAKHTGAYK